VGKPSNGISQSAFSREYVTILGMTQVLEKAIQSLNTLPEATQNQIAMRLLEEIEDLSQPQITQEEWDVQLEQDLKAGHLDALMAEAQADYSAGRVSKR
jgi:hypothetical protein